jgi:hypothetical protein
MRAGWNSGLIGSQLRRQTSAAFPIRHFSDRAPDLIHYTRGTSKEHEGEAIRKALDFYHNRKASRL